MGDQPHSELSLTACLISLFFNSQNICIINNLIIILKRTCYFSKIGTKTDRKSPIFDQITSGYDRVLYDEIIINCQIKFNFTKTPRLDFVGL